MFTKRHRFEHNEIHIAEALEISDQFSPFLHTPPANPNKMRKVIEQEHGKGSIILALRALAGAYRRARQLNDILKSKVNNEM